MLFLPLLARLGFNRLVTEAGYPSSGMIPATAALLSLLALKLLDKERRSHIDDFNCDEVIGLFAGLNVPPKKSFATAYSYRAVRDQQRGLLKGWVKALAPVLFPEPEGFSLDFHPIPFRGDPAALDRHYLPLHGKAGPSVLTFFSLEQGSRCLCYANANLTRADQHGELMRFVEFWHEVTGSDPKWLYFDSKVVDYAELTRVNRRDIHFVTIRRRGAAIVRRLEQRPATAWRRAVIDIPKRCHTHIGYIVDEVRLRGYDGPIRQIAVTGLGPERPTLFLSNDVEDTPRELIIRYASRNRIEDGLGVSVNFFHLDCLASEVRLNVDLDAALTVIANGCYRWLASRLHGVREGRPEATLPPLHRDRRPRDDPSRPPGRSLGPTVPQSNPPRGGPRPRPHLHPVARPTDDRVHLSLTTTSVRGLIIFPAVEIGDWGNSCAVFAPFRGHFGADSVGP
ncbi:MAG: hypothetical protein ACYC61_09105 [Isosphaeraceae bacterium]